MKLAGRLGIMQGRLVAPVSGRFQSFPLGRWQEEFGPVQGPVGIGVEVSTLSGEWRTLRYPGT